MTRTLTYYVEKIGDAPRVFIAISFRKIAEEYVLNLPDREVSIAIQPWFKHSPEIQITKPDQVSDICSHLRVAILAGSSALVEVTAAGKGKTSKSKKVKLMAQWSSVDQFGYETGDIRERSHILTVPASLLVHSDDDRLWAPRWMLMKTLNERSTAGEKSEKVILLGDTREPQKTSLEDFFFQLVEPARHYQIAAAEQKEKFRQRVIERGLEEYYPHVLKNRG